MEVRLPLSDEITKKLEEAGLDLMDYDARWNRYRIRLTQQDLEPNKELLKEILKRSYGQNDN
jgi:hypothetical protein